MTTSAGLLLHREGPDGRRQVLVGHLGGPLWARKQERAWSIPKGELEPGEDERTAARREFVEELGLPVPDVAFEPLGTFRVTSGKRLVVLVGRADLDLVAFRPGMFTLEWPPRSGRRQEFPELDRVAWVPLDDARPLVVAGQVPVLDALAARLAGA